MRYTYAYKTSDGTRHEASLDAESREAVFAELRKRGIKAIKVVAADGSKANGEIRGIRKRVLVSSVIGAALFAGFFVVLTLRTSSTAQSIALRTARVAVSSPRHQIYGDPVITERFERGEIDDILTRPGDRVLASFAQPGRRVGAKAKREFAIADDELRDLEILAQEGLLSKDDLVVTEDELREIRELKQVVNGMREEMRGYLANGNGTVRTFARRLIERSVKEAEIYNRVFRELEQEKSAEVRSRKNAELRQLGLRTIPAPREVEQ